MAESGDPANRPDLQAAPAPPPAGTLFDREQRVAGDIACLSCGGNLRGAHAGGACPTCGKVVSYSTRGYVYRLDEHGGIGTDVTCVQCGYDLRTLHARGACPECGQPIARSLMGTWLQFASPAWLRRLSAGVLMIVLGIGIGIACSLGLSAVTILAAVSSSPQSGKVFAIAGGLVLVGSCLVSIVGVFLATVRDPSARISDRWNSARRVARDCAWLGPLLFIVGLAAAGAGMRLALAGPVLGSILVYFFLPLGLVRHLGGLMRRVPRPGLVTFARVMFWLYLTLSTLLTASYGIMILGVARMATAAGAVPAAPGPPAGPGYIGPATTAPSANSSPGGALSVNTGSGTTTALITANAPGAGTAMPLTGPMPALLAAISVVSSIGACGWMAAAVVLFIFLLMVRQALGQVAALATAAQQSDPAHRQRGIPPPVRQDV